MARERIRLLPDGIYETSDWQEHNGHVNDLFQVVIRLEVKDDELSISCVGEPQTDGLINASPPSVAGHCFSVLLMVLFSDIPVNEGLLRPLTFLAEPGTTVCATRPAPLSSGHLDGAFKVGTMTVSTITKVLVQAADEATRDRALAPWAGACGAYPFAGLDDAGDFTVFMDMMACGVGAGATRRLDGLDVSGHMSGVGLNTPDIESNEQGAPVLYLWNSLARDSGGPGERRGGVGIDSAFILWGASALSGTTNTAGWQIPVPGAMGGYPAGTNKYERITGFEPREWFAQGRIPGCGDVGSGDSFEAKSGGVRLTTSDVWRVLMPGGGGYGDPLLRDPRASAADVALGTVSSAAARVVYGVVLDDSTAGYNAGRTEAVRADAFLARRGDADERPLGPTGRRVPMTDTVDLVRADEGDVTVCRRCDRVVAASANWRDGAGRSVRNLGDWAASVGMWIQRRDDTDLVELSCPSCGVLLETTVTAPDHLGEVDFSTERLRVLR
jgi:N-methylhydantoinase B